jgi:hypothetical protein
MYQPKRYLLLLIVVSFLLSSLIISCNEPETVPLPVAPIPTPAQESRPESDTKLAPTVNDEETKPPPAQDEKAQKPITTPESPAYVDWGKWGFPAWGPEYKATTNKTGLLFYKNGLLTMGARLPQDKVYYIWQKKLSAAEPIRFPTELIINEKGALRTYTEEKLVAFETGGFAKGEALQIALMSEDKTIMIFAKEMPYPIENKQGDYRIWVELASAGGDTFIIWGEGFEPDEEISTTSSSDGEVIKSKVKVNSKGQFMTFYFPAVVGKEDGLATFSAVGKSGEVEISFQWGLPALKFGP